MSSTDAEQPLLAVGVAVDLDNCAREPIHLPGSIQPRGVLLAVREVDQVIVQASVNLSEFTDQDASQALSLSLAEVLGTVVASTIKRACAVFGDLGERNPVELVIDVAGDSIPYDAILHRVTDGILLIELEAAFGPRPFSFPNTYLSVRAAVTELNRAASLPELYDIAAQAVHKLTGFDRVMIYRYDHDFNGEVVAEVKRADLEPFLGLHYPASDIPAQARVLYEKNWLRLISDVDYQAVPVIPNLDPSTGRPLDLSMSTLRSVSPIHIEYLHNMGVRASMSISLLRHGTLWGLIACHHYSGAHTPPYGVRAAAEFLGSALSLRLVDRDEDIQLRARLDAQAVLAKLVAAMTSDAGDVASAVLNGPSALDLIAADGVVVAAEGHLVTQGTVPDAAVVQAIARWAREHGDSVVITESLTATAPELGIAPEIASGVTAILLPNGQYVMWLRGEAQQTVDWAGDPRTKVVAEQDDGRVRLSPRNSFDRWRETVRHRSAPWTEHDRELALDLRRSMVEALYRRSQRELHIAETLQRHLLPVNLPIVAGWAISAHYETAEGGQVGGDWYDAILLRDGNLGVVIGDVAGHGLTAAATMAQLRNALRAHLLDSGSPAAALAKLNDFTNDLVSGAFATAFVATVNLASGQGRAASSGHFSPYLLTPGGGSSVLRIPTSPPLGVRGSQFVDTDFYLTDGSGLVLFTDGLVERRTESIDIGLQRLATALTRLGPHPNAAQVFTAAAPTAASDDSTVLAVHRTG